MRSVFNCYNVNVITQTLHGTAIYAYVSCGGARGVNGAAYMAVPNRSCLGPDRCPGLEQDGCYIPDHI